MALRTLSVKVPPKQAAEVQRVAAELDESVSDLLREYVAAVAGGRRWTLVDGEDRLLGYAFLLDD